MSLPKEPGVYFIDRGEYDRLPRVNWSTLKWLDVSAAHYRQALLEAYEDSDYKKLGRACHISVYEPELFQSRCVLWDQGRRSGNEWKKFCAEHAGEEILTEHQWETSLAVGKAVRDCGMAKPFISNGKGEVTVLWQHGGTDCRSRLDWVAECDALADLKTVNRRGGAGPEAFGRTCRNMKYATQAAFYRRAYQSVTGKRLPYYLIAAETMAPFAVQVYRVTEDQLEEGEKHFEQLLEQYRGCKERNSWPQYSDEVLPLELPTWGGDGDDSLVEELGLTPAIGFGDL